MQDEVHPFTLHVGTDDLVILNIDGARHTLGPKAAVCVELEKFLASANHNFEARFDGLTVDDWDKRWVDAGRLTGDFGAHRKSVGLYRAILGDKVMYIGKACEHANGGLRKRLADYTRQSDSARKTGAGPLMHSSRNDIDISLLVTGEDGDAARIAEQLERAFIERYSPPWNLIGVSQKLPRSG